MIIITIIIRSNVKRLTERKWEQRITDKTSEH